MFLQLFNLKYYVCEHIFTIKVTIFINLNMLKDIFEFYIGL